ncbi:MAG: hypothetical protein IPJ28_01900 [Betaproteobacteria bacterium]|nr:hypothetical protein [Betaproteobacteria bacterium]
MKPPRTCASLDETGLHYNYFRDFDPAIGRYVESDPIGLRGGFNTFSYVRGRPLSHFDLYGLKAQMCCKMIVPGFAHCFVNEVRDRQDECENCQSKSRRVGLQGPAPWGSSNNGAGQIKIDDGFDIPGESRCGPWNTSCGVSKCIDRVLEAYPDPSKYNALLGPNSNTFASIIARECGLSQGDGPWLTPGWGGPAAGPAPK